MFESALLKLERADHHITDLEREFAAFVASKPHRFSVQTDAHTGAVTVRVRFVKELPPHLALIIGDAVHNLRVVLDHMTWELIGVSRGTQDRYVKLPTGDGRVNFESAAKGIKTPAQWVKDFLTGLEVFPQGGGDSLYMLHLMDNADKHTVLTPVARATSHPPLRITMPGGGTLEMEGNVFVGGIGEFVNLARVPAGSSVELEHDADCPPSIFFGQPSVRAIPALKQWREDVAATLRAAGDAVAANT